ncbi:hypothetical protein NBRC116188_28110 [Oceaniserpentilla sp. 4NH20-0058]|uniref:DUF6279 family lipoprotein n=1 Tax=Oceaniserpentilla sp. 4NH20-0058 TaxID=3127660 RepID=UPI00310B7AC7
MRIIFLLIICLSITSCTSQFAYRHLDWIILWYSDDYLELTNQQESVLAKHVEESLIWHKSSELPKYRQHLMDISQDLTALPLSAYTINQHAQRLHGYWFSLRQHVSDQYAPLVENLSPDQIEYLFIKLEHKNQKRLDHLLENNAQTIQQERLEKWQEILEDFLGEITTVQITLLQEYLEQKTDTTELRTEYLREYQSQLKQTMLVADNSTDLAKLLNNPESFKSADYRLLEQQNRILTHQFFSNFSVHLTPKQIAFLQQKIRDYILFIDEVSKT